MSEFRELSDDDKKIVAMIMRKISNNRDLKKGDFKDHVLFTGKFKGRHDCHPFTILITTNMFLFIKSSEID
jgi:mRNA-degrading endonuclease YafQ of YafQ-DinJ toxin-antitoxin module